MTDTPLDDCTRCGHVRIAHHDLDYVTPKCARGGCSCPGYTTAPPPTVEDVTADERSVQVAAEALHAYECGCTDVVAGGDRFEDYRPAARAVVAALDAHDGDLRERLAAAIEAQFVGQDHHEPTYNSGRDAGLRLAAHIVRERP